EPGARQIFEFARKLGLYGITTESVESIDTIEKLVKEYDVRVGFHDHPKRANDLNYKMWDPHYILSVVKDRDRRIGSCADTVHWLRARLHGCEKVILLPCLLDEPPEQPNLPPTSGKAGGMKE